MTPLLLDENLPRASADRLRSRGYEVECVADIMPGATDEEILDYAYREQYLVVTFDRDFGTLVFHRDLPNPVGVLYLRFVPKSPEEPAGVIAQLLDDEDIHLEGRFNVATREYLRQRPLPTG